MRALAWATVFALVLSACASGDRARPGPDGKAYVWNEISAEKEQALKAQGDAKHGAVAFEVCQGCHRRGALGRDDGSYPRLAGQHATVLIKQITDVRAGRRANPKMLPFADDHVLNPQEIADIAVYLRALPVPPDNGKGRGDQLAQGRTIYVSDCASCHGRNGEGDGARFYPRVSGQHYKYLLREVIAIRDSDRHNSHPDMLKAVKPLNNAELESVTDYISRLPPTP